MRHMKINEVPRTTLVAPGEKPYVVVTDSSSYAARYDMIAAVVGNQALPPIIFTPQDRRTRNVKGIKPIFIENVLCPSINELDNCPIYLVLDRSTIHNASKIEQALCDGGYTGLRGTHSSKTSSETRESTKQHAIPRMERESQKTFITYRRYFSYNDDR